MDGNNQTQKVNMTKTLHGIHISIFLFVQHYFHRINPLVHINSRLQFANTKLTSPYYMNCIYIINPSFCEGTFRNFDTTKKIFLFFLPLYAKTNHLILVRIEYLKCAEGGATKCMYGHTFKLLYRYWMVDKLNNRVLKPEETQILNHLLALQPHCNVELYPRALACSLPGTR